MDKERINALARFLANLTKPCVSISVSRPEPSAVDVFVVLILLKGVKDYIGKQDTETMLHEMQNYFSRIKRLEQQIDEIWTKYGTNEAFFAHLETLQSRR